MAYRIVKMPLNLANSLTFCRIILTPTFVISVIYNRYKIALVIFILAGLTDCFDGVIARSMKQKTRLGSILDPLADKLLVVSSFLILSQPDSLLLYRIPSWLTIVIIMREVILLTGGVVIHMITGRLILNPSRAGKLAMLFHALTIFTVLLCNALAYDLQTLLYVLYIITCFITVISGLHYIYFGMQQMGEVSDQNAQE